MQFQKALERVLIEVFELHAFMFGAQNESPDSVDESALDMCVTVNFTGSQTGRIDLACPADLAAELAGNVLGSFDAVPQDDIDDSLVELLNVVVGRLLPAIAHSADNAASYEIDRPRIVASAPVPSDANLVACASILAETWPVVAHLYVEGAA